MLQPVRQSPVGPTSGRVAVVASEYNRRFVDGMVDAAAAVFREAGIAFEVFRVPGAFEIPVAAEILAAGRPRSWAALICLGVILRGETSHADLVAGAVTDALMGMGVRHRLPVVHEVLLLSHRSQAEARCVDPRHNRGTEAAQTAIAMIRLAARLSGGGVAGVTRTSGARETGEGRRPNRGAAGQSRGRSDRRKKRVF